MSDTIRTPDPVPHGKGLPASQRPTVQPPSSWVETKKEPLPPESQATIIAAASVDDFPEEVRPHAVDPNRQINQYILVRVLGKGGMGEVWKAWDRKLSRWAAIKFLLGESQEGVARFKREAKMAARLSHPNIAPVHEVGEAPSRQPGQPLTHFLAMEYIDGTTLGGATLSMRDRVDVFVKVAQGVEAAHKGGVVHRDIKPANVMLTKENWPYVMDFGLAKSLDGDNNLSATGAVMGTPAFMPPEQVEGRLEEIGPWSDVYSLGATMYAVFCGVHPFTAQTTLQLLQKVVNEAPLPPRQKNPEITPELEAIILKALAKRREDRYGSAAAVADALKKILVRIDAAADGAPAPAFVAPPPIRKPSLLPVLLGLFLFLGGTAGAVVWWFMLRKPPAAVVAAVVDPKPAPAVVVPPPTENKTRPKEDFKPEPKPEVVKAELKPEPKPEVKPAPPPVPATAESVIQRGFDFLAGRYRQAEFSTDADYWAAYALLQAPNSVARGRILEFLKGAAWQKSARGTSTAAARALALAATRDPLLQELTAECAQFLVEVQGPNGLWADAVEAPVRLDEPKPAEGSPFILSGDPARKRFEIARKGVANKAPDGDLVTTHLALMALYAAENCGHRVAGETWKRALDGVEAAWNENTDPAGRAAAVVSALLCRQALGDPGARENVRIQSALRTMPETGPLPLLGLIERINGLLATPVLGDRDWYAAGSKALAAAQQPDGSWADGTPQALLFLTRATASLKASEKRGGAGRLELKSLGSCVNLMFVLDASGRMREELDGRERFDVAKEAIAKVVEKLPDGAVAGLRVFGSRMLAIEPGAETDSSLIAPPGGVNRRQLLTHLQALQVKGRSSLTYTLIETAKDLSLVAPEVELAIVLFVDGNDADRRSNPVPAVGDLAALRPGMKVHVVGFNTDDDEIQARLQKMADSGGGRYIAARSAKALPAQVMAATIGETDYEVLNDRGETVLKGRLGESRDLPEGRYTVVCGGRQEKIWIHPGQLTRVIVNQQKLAAPK